MSPLLHLRITQDAIRGFAFDLSPIRLNHPKRDVPEPRVRIDDVLDQGKEGAVEGKYQISVQSWTINIYLNQVNSIWREVRDELINTESRPYWE